MRLLWKLLRRQGFAPTVIVTDKLRSYGAALRESGFSGLHEQGLRANNRAGVRTIGIVRARCKIGMTNLVYNMRRFVCLERMAAAAG